MKVRQKLNNKETRFCNGGIFKIKAFSIIDDNKF